VRKEAKKPKTQKKGKRDKELYWVAGFMVGLILLFLVAHFIFKGFNNFEHEGLTFTKERFGEITVFHYYYHYEYNGQLFKYNLFLRIDPRKNDVPVESGKILYPKGKIVYLSINGTGLEECPESSIAVASLSGFLTDNQINVKGALQDEEAAEENNVRYVTCESHPNNTVILLQSGNETKIESDGSCHTINVANCEMLKAAEKFIVQSILDAKD
jgi:hypothetical protein